MQWILRALVLTVLCAITLAALHIDFSRRTKGSDPTDDLPQTVIVFTGMFDRIDLGLDLIGAGIAERLFISGANRNAGVRVADFAEQFHLTPSELAALDDDRIVLAEGADTTLENALETKCWLALHPDIRSVTLVTSARHMPRASLALSRAIAPVRVARVVSDLPPEASSETSKKQDPDHEFRDFVATWVVTLLPHRYWPSRLPAHCPPG